MMKKYLIIAFVLVAALTFSIKDATAVTFAGGQINDIYFNNAENWVDANGDQQVSAGDYFYGILHVQNVDGRSAGTVWNEDNVTPGLDTFTGYFLTDVTGVFLHGGVSPHITLGTFTGGADPNGILSAGELASGVVLKMWTDSATKWTDNGGNIAIDIARSTDGTVWATFTANGGYWYSHAPLIPPVGAGNTVGDSFLGLNLVTNSSGLTFGLVDDPNENEINALVNLTGQSEIEVGSNYWGFQSNDPVFADIPEPGTMLLLGSGLIGLGFYSRRKVSK